MDALAFGPRLGNAVLAYAKYLGNFFWPGQLAPIYPISASINWLAVAATTAGLAGMTAGAWRWRQASPWGLVGWLWWVGMLVPVIGIVQVGSQARADRYTYLPMIGFTMAVVWGLAELGERGRLPRTVRVVIAVSLLGLMGWRTMEQLRYWRNTETLFRRTLELEPTSVQAMYGLGDHLVTQGRFEEGKKLIDEAVRRQPAFAEGLGALANLCEGKGQYAEAIKYYEAARVAEPNQTGVLNNLAWLRATCPAAEFRNGAEAVRLATRACELTRYEKPVFIGTLAAAQAEAGDFAAAIQTAERAANLATKLNLPEIAARNRELIQLYRQGKPAHDLP